MSEENNTQNTTEEQIDENKLIAQRREKLTAMRELGNAFPNDFRRDSLAAECHQKYDDKSKEELEELAVKVSVAGRMMAKRIMGKASFTQLQDMSGRIQLFLQRDALPEGVYKVYIGDQGVAKDDGRGLCGLKPAWGIQQIPRGSTGNSCEVYWANWGYNRARMEPANTATKLKCNPISRGGFYLHDSTKGFSHGCIEVESRLFDLLRRHNKLTEKRSINLQVKYIKGRATYGGTKK